MKRDYKISIKTTDEFFGEALDWASQIDQGFVPEKPIERLYFSDIKTLLQNLTPKRFELLNVLHRTGALSINALATQLKRHYKNVFDDVKCLEMLGLYLVPWDEIETTIRLAAA
jgi:predicted transcriptional regulator